MQKLPLLYAGLSLLLAGVGYYLWHTLAGIQCEPCLPAPAPCPPCPSAYAPWALWLTLGLQLLLLLSWRYHGRRVRG